MNKKTLERQFILQCYLSIKVISKRTLSPVLKTDIWQNYIRYHIIDISNLYKIILNIALTFQ